MEYKENDSFFDRKKNDEHRRKSGKYQIYLGRKLVAAIVKKAKRKVSPSFIQIHQSIDQKTTYVYTSGSNLLL